MYLLNVYSIVKLHEGVYFAPHLVGNENGQKLTPLQKNFSIFLKNADLRVRTWFWDNKKAPLTGAKYL